MLIFSAGLIALSVAPTLRADDWPAATTREVFSKNRDYFVRVTPGESIGETVGFAGAKIGKHAVAKLFHLRPDKSYALEREFELLNPVAPVSFFVSNAGQLVTLDNWHNVGYGNDLSLYGSDGMLIKSYRLSDLFQNEEVNSLSHSVSSIWWHKEPSYIDEAQKTFYMGSLQSLDFQILILRLEDGSIRRCSTTLRFHCREVRQPPAQN